MRSPNCKLIPLLAFRFATLTTSFFLLLAPPTLLALYLIGTGLAQEPEIICLYKRAMEEMRGPIQLEDLRAVELKTTADYNDLAQLCIDGKRYDKALEAIEEALDLDPFDPVANLHAGLAHYKLGEYQKAAYHLEWALRAGRVQKTRDTRLGEELLSGPASNPSTADSSIMGLLNKARKMAKEQEAKKASLETGEKTPVGSESRPFLGGGSPFPSAQSSNQLKRTHGDLSTQSPIKKGKKKEAVKATLKEDTTQTKPSSRKKKGSRLEAPPEAQPGPPDKKVAKSDTSKEDEEEGAERFVLQPFNPGRK